MHNLVSTPDLSVTKVGGKALRLAQMIAANFPVKPAVVLTEDEVAAAFESGVVPTDLLDQSYSSLKWVKGVSVRSSAVGEDGVLSWAGQFQTLLFIQKVDLEQALLQCASASSHATVKAYAKINSIAVPPLALVVQEMVKANVAGVMFTTNPNRQDLDEMIIESVDGVGRSLVDGTREPTRYRLERTSGKVLEVSGNLDEARLSANQLTALHNYGLGLWRLFGEHQDVEWAVEEGTGKIFINQSRDILKSQTRNVEEVRPEVIQRVAAQISSESTRLTQLGVRKRRDYLSDQNIAELLTPHPTQMAFGLFTYVFAHGDGGIRTGRNEIGYEIGSELDEGFFQLVGGQPRCSILHDAFTYRIQGFALADYLKLVDHYLGRIDKNPSLANYPEVVLYDQNPSLDFLASLYGDTKARELRTHYDHFSNRIVHLEDTLAKECREVFLPRWYETMKHLRAETLGRDPVGLVKRFFNLCELLRTDACRMFFQGTRLGFFAYSRLRNLMLELYGEEGEGFLNTLTGGIPMERNPNLRFNVCLAAMRDGVLAADDVIREFGHLGPHELEISVPRYNDQIGLVGKLASMIHGDPEENLRLSYNQSAALRQKLLVEARSRREELEREIRVTRTYLPLREEVKFAFLHAYDLLRQTLVRLEQVLGWEEGLIFHLDPREVFVLLDAPVSAQELALQRSKLWNEHRSLYVPALISTIDLEPIGEIPTYVEGTALKGIGVTNFITEGEVVVARSIEDQEALARLKPGSVLVTVTTDPA